MPVTPNFKDLVFVLSLVPYRGSDLVVNFLSKDLGKLTAVIYGGKKINKSSSFLFQPGDWIELEFEKNENKEFVKVLNTYGYKLLNIEHFSYNRFLFHTYLLEISAKISKPELLSEEVYTILSENNLLNWDENNRSAFIVWSLWKLIQAGGYQIDFSCCGQCQKKTWRLNQPGNPTFRKQTYTLDNETGSIICNDCKNISKSNPFINASMIKILWLYTEYSGFENSLKNLPTQVLLPLLKIVNNYLLSCYDIRPKSLEAFLQMIDSSSFNG